LTTTPAPLPKHKKVFRLSQSVSPEKPFCVLGGYQIIKMIHLFTYSPIHLFTYSPKTNARRSHCEKTGLPQTECSGQFLLPDERSGKFGAAPCKCRAGSISCAVFVCRINLIRVSWHLLKPKPWPVYGKTLRHQESDYDRMTGGGFRECLGGCAACGLFRKNFPRPSDLSRPERTSWG